MFCFESPPRPPREVPGRGAGGAAAGEGELARAVLQDALTEVHENEVWPKGTAASDTHEYPVCPTGMSGAASCMGGVWVIALTRGAVGVLGPLLDQRARAGMAGGEISGGTETLDAEATSGGAHQPDRHWLRHLYVSQQLLQATVGVREGDCCKESHDEDGCGRRVGCEQQNARHTTGRERRRGRPRAPLHRNPRAQHWGPGRAHGTDAVLRTTD